MRRVLGLVMALHLGWSAAVAAQCPGDCDGNGAVSIDELVTAVRIALGQGSLSGCPTADSSADGRVTVDDLVRAVNAALRGCAATPTASPSTAPAATLSPSPSPSVPPTNTPRATVTPSDNPSATVSPSATPTATSSPSAIVTLTATASATLTRTGTPSRTSTSTSSPPATSTSTPAGTSTPVSTSTSTSTLARTATSTSTGTSTVTATRSATATVTQSSTRSASPTATPIPTHTRTATATASPSPTRTGGPLGTRRFSLDPTTSAFIGVLGPSTQVGATGFTGHLDLEAGVPDPQTGRAIINATGSSTYLQLKSGTDLVCIRPLVPANAVGLVDCNGGTNLGVTIRQDHRIGVVGSGGYTAQMCSADGGTVEPGDLPHPQVCNGPLTVAPSAAGDSGPGAVFIAPDATFNVNGLPAQLTFEVGDTCTGSGTGFTDVLPLISGHIRTEILHANNGSEPLVYDNPGEGFSCPAWTQEDGPGQLILSFPTLHGAAPADLINVFVFDD